jgi:AAA family ATP:ADP antiporter
VDGLVSAIGEVDASTRYYILKALNKLRARRDDLRFDRAVLRGPLLAEVESYFAILKVAHLTSGGSDESARLLARALGEELDLGLERIFRFLQLTYPPADIHGAYMGAVSGDKSLRASAIEFLDNLLERELKKYIIPIVDNISVGERITQGERLFDLRINDQRAAIMWLLRGDAHWLKACAAFSVSLDSAPDIRAVMETLRADPNPIVRETAEVVLSR